MMFPVLFLSINIAAADINPQLLSIQAKVKENSNLVPFEARIPLAEATNAQILDLINSEALTNAKEFNIASDCLQTFSNDYEIARVQYELGYSAVALGDAEARKKLATRWDALLMTLGRHRSMGVVKLSDPAFEQGTWKTHPAPKQIIEIWVNPARIMKVETDSPEVAKMFEDDQNIRSGSTKDIDFKKMMAEDAMRMARIRKIVATGKLKTAEDYYRAAFLYQHGQEFEDYQMAHQLSVCSLLLGKKEAKWIGAASYDRMLRSCAHKQRWATQYSFVAGKQAIQPYDTAGISDVQRKQIVGLTLDEAIKRVLK